MKGFIAEDLAYRRSQIYSSLSEMAVLSVDIESGSDMGLIPKSTRC
jgi:hypothetical protein